MREEKSNHECTSDCRRNGCPDCPHGYDEEHTCPDCDKEEKGNNGAICGGVISESMEKKLIKKHGVWATAMLTILPDKEYNRLKSS